MSQSRSPGPTARRAGLLVVGLLGCGPGVEGGKGGPTGGAQLEGTDSGAAPGVDGGAAQGPLVAPDGLRVLFYRGEGGFRPRSSGEGAYAELSAHLWAARGYSLDETDVWPAELGPYRLINLVAPGHSDPAARFSAAQVEQLRAAMDAGARLVIWGERSACRTETAQALIDALDVDLGFTGEAADTNRVVDTAAFGEHPVAEGLGVVRFREPCTVEGGAGQILVFDSAERPIGAWARPGRGGELMVIGDLQALDDSGSLRAPGVDNLRFGENLALVALP